MNRDIFLFEQMQLGCQQALDYTTGLELADFVADRRTHDSVMHNLDLIGQSAAKISKDTRLQYPNLEWRKMIALSQVVNLHFGFQDEIIWDLVQNKLPQWLLQISHILKENAVS